MYVHWYFQTYVPDIPNDNIIFSGMGPSQAANATKINVTILAKEAENINIKGLSLKLCIKG